MTSDDMLALCGPIHGWMYDCELLWLYEQAQSRDLIVEIGTWKGKSTLALASGSPGLVVTIDHYRGGNTPEEQAYHPELQTEEGRKAVIATARRNFRDHRVIPMVMPVEQALDWLGEALRPANMGFVDGGHAYDQVKSDIQRLLPLLAPEALLCGHDRGWPGVQRAIYELFAGQVKLGPGSIWYV